MKRNRNSFTYLCQSNVLSCSTLTSGQAFRWRKTKDVEEVWRSPLLLNDGTCAVIDLKWENEEVSFKTTNKDGAALLRDYFRLDVDLGALTEEWRGRDKLFENNECGIRLMRQQPFETLMSFICSQNNNIKRITAMIDTFCKEYGSKLSEDLYSFPTLEQLKNATEERSVIR